MLRTLDLYLNKRVASSIFFTLFSLVTFSVIIRLTEELASVGKGSYGLWDAVYYSVAFGFPDINSFFPMAGLLGAMIALGILAGNSELIVIRSVGVSRLRIIMGLFWTLIPFSLANLAIQQWVAPQITAHAQQLKSEKITGRKVYSALYNLWAKSTDGFIYSDVINKTDLRNVFLLKFNEENNSLSQFITARKARWDEKNSQWVLEDAEIYEFKSVDVDSNQIKTKVNIIQDGLNKNPELELKSMLSLLESNLGQQQNLQVSYRKRYNFKTDFNPEKISLVSQDSSNFSLTELWNYIKFLDDSKQNSDQYKYLFWSKLLSGLSFMVMLFVATVNIFGSMRSVNLMLRVFYAIVLGLIFYVFNSTVGPFLMRLNFSAFTAALFPAFSFMLYGLFQYRRKL